MNEKKNIVLIGFMGCGKSKTSRELATRCARRRYSTDKMIQRKEGMTIPEIFRLKGEAYFRRVEKDVVAKVAVRKNAIIDCGGGVAVDPENMAHLKKNGVVFYLKASPKCLFENIKAGKPRPLMQVADPLAKIKELLRLREKHYRKADHVIDANFKTIPDIADQIESLIAL